MKYTVLRTGDSTVDRNLDLISSALSSSSETTGRQIEFSPLVSTNATLGTGTYAFPIGGLSLSFKAEDSGIYQIKTTNYIMYNSSSGQSISSRIVATKGSPVLRAIGQNNVDTTAGFGTALFFTYQLTAYYSLTANTDYTFQLQGQTTGGTLTFAFGSLAASLIAEQI